MSDHLPLQKCFFGGGGGQVGGFAGGVASPGAPGRYGRALRRRHLAVRGGHRELQDCRSFEVGGEVRGSGAAGAPEYDGEVGKAGSKVLPWGLSWILCSSGVSTQST